MTPELRQAIEILQLSSFELNNLIGQELEKNPIIELMDNDDIEINNKAKEKNSKEEIDWEQYFDHSETNYHGSQRDMNEHDYNQENFVKDFTTLKDHLLFQLHISAVKPKHKNIGEYIIECIDSNGYLIMDIEEIASELNEKKSDVGNILTLIQSFDP